MLKKLLLVPALIVALTLFMAGATAADTSTSTFDLHIADQFLVDNAGSAAVAIAMATNGDTIEISGGGSFDAGAKTAAAEGTFVHNLAAGGSATGTWSADGVISFQFYGCGGDLPEDFCGGLLKLDVTLVPDAAPDVELDGTLWVDCLIGDKIPSNRTEGVRLLVQDVINFNQTVFSGLTLFIEQG